MGLYRFTGDVDEVFPSILVLRLDGDGQALDPLELVTLTCAPGDVVHLEADPQHARLVLVEDHETVEATQVGQLVDIPDPDSAATEPVEPTAEPSAPVALPDPPQAQGDDDTHADPDTDLVPAHEEN